MLQSQVPPGIPERGSQSLHEMLRNTGQGHQQQLWQRDIARIVVSQPKLASRQPGPAEPQQPAGVLFDGTPQSADGGGVFGRALRHGARRRFEKKRSRFFHPKNNFFNVEYCCDFQDRTRGGATKA